MSDPIWGMIEELHNRVERLKQMGLVKEPPKSLFKILHETFEAMEKVIRSIFFG